MANKYPIVMVNGVPMELPLGDYVKESNIVWFGDRGIFAGGILNIYSLQIDYVTISSTGNSTNFGNLLQASGAASSFSNGSRGIFAGGESGRHNIIQFITISTTGNSVDFGDLLGVKSYCSGCSNGVRGVGAGGVDVGGNAINVIEYITIATLGNSIDFGDLSITRAKHGSCSSSVRGFWFCDWLNNSNTIDYVTIATLGNATNFGVCTTVGANSGKTSCSDTTRGIVAAGGTYGGNLTNVIEYITMASTGNATDFGDLTVARYGPGSCANGIRGLFGGGMDEGVGGYNTIDYITIATVGNATDFGDCPLDGTYGGYGMSSCSGN